MNLLKIINKFINNYLELKNPDCIILIEEINYFFKNKLKN